MLALDLNVIEALFEGEPDHFSALWFGRAIGDQCEKHAELLEAIERLMSAGEDA